MEWGDTYIKRSGISKERVKMFVSLRKITVKENVYVIKENITKYQLFITKRKYNQILKKNELTVKSIPMKQEIQIHVFNWWLIY